MQSSARDGYLETEILTATPQKLQLTLIEAAIRFIQRARADWQADQNEEAGEALIRAQRIMAELLGGLNVEIDPELAKKVAPVYVFVFRSLVEASRDHDEEKLDGALKVLNVERETWTQLCRKLGSTKDAADTPGDVASFPSTPQSQTPPALHLASDSGLPGEASTGFSLEA